ncbi:hypothetical protein AMTRI_Chr01g105330 [Amborella trichopoda]
MLYLYVSSYARTPLKKSARISVGGARASVHRSSRGNGALSSCPRPCFLPLQFNSDSRVKPSPLCCRCNFLC